MKQKVILLSGMLALLGFISVSATAAEAPSEAEMQVMAARAQALEQQITKLQGDMQVLKTQLKVKKVHATKPVAMKNRRMHSHQAQGEAVAEAHIATLQNVPDSGADNFPFDVDVPGQSFVSTGPYIGVPLVYSGDNLIINTPNINEDVSLLNLRKHIRERLAALGRPISEEHSHLILSGIIEAQAMYKTSGSGAHTSDIDLTSAELDGYILGPSSWTSGLLAFAYDNDRGSEVGSISSNSRPVNSRLYVNKAFIVIGDFQQSPFYGTLGQMYVPFGTYSSNMVSSPLTKLLGRTKTRALLVGYQQQNKNALYSSVYVFQGDTHTSAHSFINNGGVNAGYRYSVGKFSGDVGGGVIANIADSVNLQRTGNAPLFGGFGGTDGSGSETIVHRVPAVDVRGTLSIGEHIDLLAEYVGATTSFNVADLTLNNHGANLRALNVEAAYTFLIYEKPSTVALGYGQAKDGLAIGLPTQRYSAVFNTSIWRNTLQSLEFRHDVNYASVNTSSGSMVTGPTGPGRPDNMITAQFDLYF
jgi:hypothetical protein